MKKILRKIALILYWIIFPMVLMLATPIIPFYWLFKGKGLQTKICDAGRKIRFNILRMNCKGCESNRYWMADYRCTYCKRYLLSQKDDMYTHDNYKLK